MDTNELVRIRPAIKSDARMISAAIIEAVGPEITLEFAGDESRVPLVEKLFEELAEIEDSQYSYKNSLIAETPDGKIAGVLIFYDGARLHNLRKNFIIKVREILGYELEEEKMADEASADEMYLDSLCIFQPFRGKGIAKKLINEASKASYMTMKPLGLLVDKDNQKAYRLYERLGFKKIDERPFANTMMDHLQRPMREP